MNCKLSNHPIEKHNLLDGRSGGLGNEAQPDVAPKKPILKIKMHGWETGAQGGKEPCSFDNELQKGASSY